MGYVGIVGGTVLPFWPPPVTRCRKPSGCPNASGDRVDSTLEPVLDWSSVVDVAPDSVLDFGGMVVEPVLLLLVLAAVPPELKSLWRLFFGVNTKCTV